MFEGLSEGQHPETLFITCSDSRIIPNIFTGHKPGDVFMVRNIGPMVPPYPSVSGEAAALEYALHAFDIKDIIICGHSQCGAMKGLLTPNIAETLPTVASWISHAHPVLDEMHDDHSEPHIKLAIATQKNIVLQMEHLKTYPQVAQKLANKELTIHGWLYEFETGKIFIHEPSSNNFVQLEESDALKLAMEERKNKIITQVAMDYLHKKSNPKSINEYRKLMDLFASLNKDIQPIWEDIKAASKQKIWAELGDFYESPQDARFINLVESGSKIKLTNLDELQKNISESNGVGKKNKSSFFSNSQPLGEPRRPGLRKRKNESNESSEEKKQSDPEYFNLSMDK